MRQIVIDHVRARGALRRGGDVQVASPGCRRPCRWPGRGATRTCSLDEALHRLGEVDPELASLVETSFYAKPRVVQVAS